MEFAVFIGNDMLSATVYTSNLLINECKNPREGDQGYLFRTNSRLVYNSALGLFHVPGINPLTFEKVRQWVKQNRPEQQNIAVNPAY